MLERMDFGEDVIIISRKSNVTLLVGGTLLVLCLLFPPWSFTYQSAGISQVRKTAGYGFLLTPPELEGESIRSGVAIDWSRLILQVVAIAISTGWAWLILKHAGRNTVQLGELSNRIKNRLKLLIGLLLGIRFKQLMWIGVWMGPCIVIVGSLVWWFRPETIKTEQFSDEDISQNEVNKYLDKLKEAKSWGEADALFKHDPIVHVPSRREQQKKALSHNAKIYYKVKKFVDAHPDVEIVGSAWLQWNQVTRPFRVNLLLSRREHAELLDFLGLAVKREPNKSDPSFFQAIEDLKQWDFTYTR
jgi:hypothetical protein